MGSRNWEAATYFGIDFSGAAAPWKPRCSRPTVWVATLDDAATPRLLDLRPVQDLPGSGEPFARLTSLLRAGDFAAAAIDAPFSIPAEHLPPGGHPDLLAQVAALPKARDRPFPNGAALVAMAERVAPLRRAKPFRETEAAWIRRGVPTRSTLWNGARGGAPFTAACIELLASAGRPIWPWQSGPGLLVEAFPAAQLQCWHLPFKGYGKPEQHDARERILAGLAERVSFDGAQRGTMLATADALDSVLAAFSGIAAVRSGRPVSHPADGLISVLDDDGSARAAGAAESRRERDEIFENLLRRPGVRIERIVSRGHATSRTDPCVQDWDEWVLVIEGAARLQFVGTAEHVLDAGDHLLIPAGVPHLVTYTADPTVWMAVHFDEPLAPGGTV